MSRSRGARIIEGPIYKVGQLRCVDVPAEVAVTLGDGPKIPVRARIGAAEAQGSLVRRKDGDYRLFLPTELREPNGVDDGDVVRVELAIDHHAGEPELPAELLERLGAIDGGLAALESRSPADRRQLARFIGEARSAATRSRRIDKAVEMVLGPKPRPRRRPEGDP